MTDMILKVLGFLLGIVFYLIVLSVVFGLPIMYLWNWLVVDLFHLPHITFYQAVGLYVLCDLLFKKNELNPDKD